MNALAKQPFADFTAEQKRYKIILRVTLANGFRNWRFINRLKGEIAVTCAGSRAFRKAQTLKT
jgi:hypothetical protein